MKKILLLAACALALFLAVRWLRGALASDETRIRWRIDAMAAGFNASSARRTLSGISSRFREEDSGLTREEVHQFLAWLFLTQRDAKTKEFQYRVETGEPEIQVSRDGKKRTAELRLPATFLRMSGGSWKRLWTVRIHADLEKEPEGWKVVRSSHETVEGRMPF